MSFARVFPSNPLERRVSQTMLRHYNNCRRSGLLYHETKSAGVQTVEMVRGSCVHWIKETATNLMVEQGEPTLPAELIKVIVDEAFERFPVPIEEHDYVRELSYRWAQEWTIDPAQVVACETLFVLELEGWHVRCKIDFAELREQGRQVVVDDYKSGRGAPPYEKISRKRTDGTISGKNFQLILYVVALVYGRPVRVEMERCRNCESDPEHAVTDLCVSCAGSGFVRVETIEPFPIAPHAHEAIAEFVYPGAEIKTGEDAGKMLRQPVGFMRMEIDAYRESLIAIVHSLQRSEETGDWPAIISDTACEECPCSAMCPIPVEMRDHRGEINNYEQLQEAATRYYLDGLQRNAQRREIKAAAKTYGGPSARVRFGKDRVWELGDVRESTEISDRDAMFEAVQRSVDLGEPFDREDFVKTSKSTPFSERTLTEDELAQEAAEQETA